MPCWDARHVPCWEPRHLPCWDARHVLCWQLGQEGGISKIIEEGSQYCFWQPIWGHFGWYFSSKRSLDKLADSYFSDVGRFELNWWLGCPIRPIRTSLKAEYDKVILLLATVRRKMRTIRLLLLLSLLCFIYNVAKFVAAFRCPHSLWNFPSGCVHVAQATH